MNNKKYKCEVCGRESFKKIQLQGYILCSKHMHQLYNNGKFLDNIQRTNKDLNDYKIVGDEVIFNLYNQKNEKIDEFIIDLEDLDKVKYHKWRYSHQHIVTGLPSKGQQRDLSHIILGVDKKQLETLVVDHIDNNPRNNKKSNLRLCSQSKNVLNKSFMSNNTSGFIGVTFSQQRNKYESEIRYKNIRCHFKRMDNIEDAVYIRYIAEQIVFREFANIIEQNKKKDFCKNMSQERKNELYNYVITTITKKLGDKLC